MSCLSSKPSCPPPTYCGTASKPSEPLNWLLPTQSSLPLLNGYSSRLFSAYSFTEDLDFSSVRTKVYKQPRILSCPLAINIVSSTEIADQSSSISPETPSHSSTAFTSEQTVLPVTVAESGKAIDTSFFNPYPPAGIEEALSRRYLVSTQTWTSAHAKDHSLASIHFPEAMLAFPVIHDRLGYFHYVSCDVDISVEVASPATNCGAIICGGLQFYNSLVGHRHQRAEQIAQMPFSGIISASRGGSYKTSLKWAAPYPFVKIADLGVLTKGVLGSFFVTVLSPLSQPGSTVQPVTVNVYAQIKNVNVAGFVPAALTAAHDVYLGSSNGVPRVLSKAQSLSAESLARTVKGTVASIATATQHVPTTLERIGSLSVTDIVSGVSDFARAVVPLLDQPPNLTSYSKTLTNQSDLVYTEGLSAGGTYSFKPGSQTGPANEFVGTTDINPSFLEIAGRPGIFSWGAILSTNSGKVIQHWVHPLTQTEFLSGATQMCIPTPLMAASLGFRYWRGSLRYLFQFYASAMTSAKLRICYFPDVTDPPASIEDYAGDVISKVIDISGDTEVAFEVPFLYQAPYAPCNNSKALSGSSTFMQAVVSPHDTIGSLAVYILSPPASYDSQASSVQYVLWVAASEDFQLMNHVDRVGEAIPISSSIRSAGRVPNAIAQCTSLVQSMFKKKFPPIHPSSKILERGLFDADPLSSVTQLYRRPMDWLTSTNATELIESLPWDQESGNVFWKQFMASSFRGWRGSIRVSGYQLGEPNPCFFYNQAQDYGWSGLVVGTPPLFTVDVPNLDPSLYYPSADGKPVFSHINPTHSLLVDYVYSHGSSSIGTYDLFIGAADDFSFFDLRPFTTVAVPNAAASRESQVFSHVVPQRPSARISSQ